MLRLGSRLYTSPCVQYYQNYSNIRREGRLPIMHAVVVTTSITHPPEDRGAVLSERFLIASNSFPRHRYESKRFNRPSCVSQSSPVKAIFNFPNRISSFFRNPKGQECSHRILQFYPFQYNTFSSLSYRGYSPTTEDEHERQTP